MRQEKRHERDERQERETRHNNLPPTNKLRLRFDSGWGGVWVDIGLASDGNGLSSEWNGLTLHWKRIGTRLLLDWR